MIEYIYLSNEELSRRIEAKDRAACKFVYDKHAGAVYKVILQNVACQKEAEAILATTFIMFFKNPPVSVLKRTMLMHLHNVALSRRRASAPPPVVGTI